MNLSRRPQILQRRRVFLGCEGESERSYGVFLKNILEQRRQDVHLDVVLLTPGGGDPLALVERAQSKLDNNNKIGRSPPYQELALLLDSDVRGRDADRDKRAIQLARSLKVRLIWQDPCHEALLLRHLEGCSGLRPTTAGVAQTKLIQKWPAYEKGMAARRLGLRLNHDSVVRAAAVELELKRFPVAIGFL